jgi:hypothetical protein
MSITYNPKVVTDGLVLCLDAANKRSYPGTGTTMTDLKNGHTGTLTNMEASNFSSLNGGIFSFDGTNEDIDFGDILDDDITDSFTIGCYLRFSSLSGSINPFSKHGSYWVHKENSTNKLRFKIETTSNGRKEVEANLALSTSVFYFLVGVLDQQKLLIYVDGMKYNETTFTGTFKKTTGTLNWGGYGGDIDMFPGDLGHSFIYNRALAADEVLQNYNATRGRYR